MTDQLDITLHGFMRDHTTGERLHGDEAVTIARGVTVRAIVDPLGLVSAVVHQTTSKRVAVWELQGLIDRQTLQQRLDAVPEARRRIEYRLIAQRQRGIEGPCPSCGGAGWVEDETEGRGYECPGCRGR